jgi:hypothetical protein
VIAEDGDRAKAPALEAVGSTAPILDVDAPCGIDAGAVGATGHRPGDVFGHGGKTVLVGRGERGGPRWWLWNSTSP